MEFNWPQERPHHAIVERVIDGDTVVCNIDMDLRSWLQGYRVRLAGCNAWEVGTDGGKAARDNLAEILQPGTPVVLTTIKDYKFGGEFIARVWVGNLDLVAELIKTQWLAPWDGKGKAADHVPPWPRTL